MKEKKFKFNELSENQRRIQIDMVQIYQGYLDARKKMDRYKGSMYWKKSKGHEYLFKLRDRFGNGKSLGRRSQSTEKILQVFKEGKQEAQKRLKSFELKLKEQSKFCKAAGIQRVPTILCNILRLLEKQGWLGRNILIVGTNALYAYEAETGVHFDTALTSTEDMDILWDTRSRVSLFIKKNVNPTGLIDLLKKADPSFKLTSKGDYRAINQKGYFVDLIKPIPKPPWKPEPKHMGGTEDLHAAEINNLQWLVSSPKIHATVIGGDGFPAPLVVPDPRAFALHKLWLSRQEDRAPLKRPRDRAQAIAVFYLVSQYLPQLKFDPDALRMFPKEIVEKSLDSIKEQNLPIGF